MTGLTELNISNRDREYLTSIALKILSDEKENLCGDDWFSQRRGFDINIWIDEETSTYHATAYPTFSNIGGQGLVTDTSRFTQLF